MPADATLALAGVAAELADLYPARPVKTAKRPVAGNRPPIGGLPADVDFKNGAFVISATEPEEVDAGGDFESVTVAYSILVEFLLPTFAKTQDGKDPMFNEDAEVRDVREAVRRRLYKPRLGALASPTNVRNRPRQVYETSGTGGAPVIVSGQVFTYEVTEARAE